MEGDLRPGTRLNERILCNLLGVSKTPLREALRCLERDGIVVVGENGRLEVAAPSEGDVRDVFECRMAIEGMAAKLACERASREDLSWLEQLHASQKDMLARGDVAGLVKANTDFHEFIITASGNRWLMNVFEMMQHVILHVRRYLTAFHGPQMIEEHGAVVDAFLARDPDGAERAMRQHIREALRRVLSGGHK